MAVLMDLDSSESDRLEVEIYGQIERIERV